MISYESQGVQWYVTSRRHRHRAFNIFCIDKKKKTITETLTVCIKNNKLLNEAIEKMSTTNNFQIINR